MRSFKLVLVAATTAIAVGGQLPTAALASASRSTLFCATQSLTVTPLGSVVMVDSRIDNACGRMGSFVIRYRLVGPTQHSKTIRIQLPSHPVDLVTYFGTPASGHYDLRQEVVGNHREIGRSTASFDVI
jgi:hypothetical protein